MLIFAINVGFQIIICPFIYILYIRRSCGWNIKMCYVLCIVNNKNCLHVKVGEARGLEFQLELEIGQNGFNCIACAM
jgi:hypothetical protein